MADDVRKTLPKLIEELNEHRQLDGKRFRHKKSGDAYILLFSAFDEHSNEKQAVYGFASFPRVKFVCPMPHFLDAFEPDIS